MKGKTKGHVLLVVIDLFCLMFYFGFVFYYGLNGCDSRSLSNNNGDDSENNFDRIDVQKKEEKFYVLWSSTS